MSRDREYIGLSVWQSGRPVPAGMSWEEFVRRVIKAAQKPKVRRKGNAQYLRTTAPPELHQVPPHRQCRFIHSKGPNAGKRCKQWAMIGATRCCKHGGYRQVPEHPATVRRLNDVIEVDAQRQAFQELRHAPETARSAAEAILDDLGIPRRPVTILAGVQAYLMDDAGRAWRRWIDQAKRARPSDEPLARRKK